MIDRKTPLNYCRFLISWHPREAINAKIVNKTIVLCVKSNMHIFVHFENYFKTSVILMILSFSGVPFPTIIKNALEIC